MMERLMSNPVDRLSSADCMYLAMQRASVPNQFGAILLLEPTDGFNLPGLMRTLGERISAIPRMRQRAMKAPWGCGRPVWIDDATFAVERHLRLLECPSPGDESALLSVAAGLLARRLPVDRPLWSATVVTGLTKGRVALVLVAQHALADGIGGLAVLYALADGAAPGTCRTFPLAPPSTSRLAADAMLTRVRLLTRAMSPIRSALESTGSRSHSRIGQAASCSLSKPTGGERRLAITRTNTADILAAAHRHDATVNDVLLSAIGGALGRYLGECGEHADTVVVGIPVGMRQAATVGDIGNRTMQIRVAIPTAGEPALRLRRVKHAMRVSKRSAPGPISAASASVVVRAMLAVGIYQWYMRRQRYLHCVVTNVHGPDRRLTLCGAPVTDIVPLAVGGGGNVVVTFAALSYAGTLVVTVIADPDPLPDLAEITVPLAGELRTLFTM
ncbi:MULTISPECIES: wax ester/triacylglycerol synthase domain-containing protein [Nocardiaceae]|uniref:wax ester/triacylglycerol synthase domain-containing protein n=1 Tax=Nocardiaceae TaxID=85025 RepID=UPI0027E208CA|nr:wax ester/triacylglycerol synthase domain-containing protein [Rhodococcus sp. I2R]